MEQEKTPIESDKTRVIAEICDLVTLYRLIPDGGDIEFPDKLLSLGKIDPSVSRILHIPDTAFVSHKVIKHIVERRGELALEIVKDIPKVLYCPTKVADNSEKRPSSYLFARMNGKAKAVVLDIAKTPDGNRVVSAFFVDTKTYKKLKDISGRSDVPPLDISPVESISTAQKSDCHHSAPAEIGGISQNNLSIDESEK